MLVAILIFLFLDRKLISVTFEMCSVAFVEPKNIRLDTSIITFKLILIFSIFGQEVDLCDL